MKIILTLIKNQTNVVIKLMQDAYGWALGLLGSALTFFAPEKYAFICVLVAILLDAFFGIMRSVRSGGFILSKLGQQTGFKIVSYGAALVMVFMVERLAHDGGALGVKVAAGWAIACEFWSISASVLILWPEATFFRVMRHHLRGEIAAKLGEDAAKELDAADERKKPKPDAPAGFAPPFDGMPHD